MQGLGVIGQHSDVDANDNGRGFYGNCALATHCTSCTVLSKTEIYTITPDSEICCISVHSL